MVISVQECFGEPAKRAEVVEDRGLVGSVAGLPWSVYFVSLNDADVTNIRDPCDRRFPFEWPRAIESNLGDTKMPMRPQRQPDIGGLRLLQPLEAGNAVLRIEH